MWAVTKKLQRNCLNTFTTSLLQNTKVGFHLVDYNPKILASNVFGEISEREYSIDRFNGVRSMSTVRGRSWRSKVDNAMKKDVGKSLQEQRRAKKLKKKLMTDEERLIWNLRRAKKKVALLLQKLKKYELPDLPTPRHDPELLTPEQLQAYKKIGFRNKNYVPVGVRGVFGGVVQNMHLHWKFHETVQVCCDNFPKEKIKEMATMLARLSGGIVVNIHDVKTIIMFRGRNYRQPKNLIPINTLTKRKALFKARFEQALDSQKLNIKKIEQELRRMGVNPEDPVAMASIQRVASTFFNAIDDKQGSPYVFHYDKRPVAQPYEREEENQYSEQQEQEQLDKFIADIEEAAEQEWEEEEAAEKEEFQRIKYRNRENSAGRIIRADMLSDDDSEGHMRMRQSSWKESSGKHRTTDKRRKGNEDEDENEDENDEADALEEKWDSVDLDSDEDHSGEARDEYKVSKNVNRKYNTNDKASNKEAPKRNAGSRSRGRISEDSSGSEDIFGDSEELWESDNEEEPNKQLSQGHDYLSSGDENEDYEMNKKPTKWVDHKRVKTPKQADEDWDSD
ncbi:hypothetical protein AQUCO_01100498v1 [Aquilegia coerulea]|uniref:CRM domain-containing protein n=1 Tax=Aquilegia coerulea TaxID=218851 RepID=A0A2G5E7I1_AQUCA|nr:hypothetical protein AQUCO_01100498v1 [Aquilegia coerulea]